VTVAAQGATTLRLAGDMGDGNVLRVPLLIPTQEFRQVVDLHTYKKNK
jgi:hypothetical protein